MKDIFVANENSKYGDGIVINLYDGKYSLIPARQKGDEIYLEWCFPQDPDRKPKGTSVPWKVVIGESEEQAAATLAKLYRMIVPGTKENAPRPEPVSPPVDDSSIPF